MILNNDSLEKMKLKRVHNKKYSKWFFGLSKEYEGSRSSALKNRSDRVNDCLNFWMWDKYTKNKLLDLRAVNRCNDNRFCPNCRAFDLAHAINNLSPHFSKLLQDGYLPFLLTITVPNVPGDELRATIEKMNTAFRKFFNLLSLPIGTGQHGFSERLVRFHAAIKVFEVTYNKKSNTFHPHFHVMVFTDEYDEGIYYKHIKGLYSRKRQSYNYHSHMDMHIMKIWTMCYDNIRMTVKNYEKFDDDLKNMYLCDIKEMDSNGVREVLKYTFKDTDILNYYVFKTLYFALEHKRIRQGYGLLYNVKLESESDGEKQSLDEYLTIKENPEQLVTQEINQLQTVYGDYRKISRFNAHKSLNDVLNTLE